MQRKPVLHARDHLPGGADPIPGMSGGGGSTAAPVDEQIPNGAQPGPVPWWWWRLRSAEPVGTGTQLQSPEENAGEATESMRFVPFVPASGPWDEELPEQTFGHPGPNADSLAMKRAQNVHYNPGNWWAGVMPLTRDEPDEFEWGAGAQFTFAGWFNFDALAEWDILNMEDKSAGHTRPTYLLLTGGGGVILHRHGTEFASAGGLISPGTWTYIAVTCANGRLRVYVNPGAPTEVPVSGSDTWFGSDFPFPGPTAMDTWGLANGDFTAAQLAERLTSNGFRTAIVQLNASYGPGHAAYIAKLAADVATLKAAGLTVVGWGEVDGTTGADLTATGVDGWMPQIEGDGQRIAVINALNAGVGAGLPKAVVATAGGLDTAAKVAALHTAGITAATVEVYAEQGAYPYSNVDAMLSNFVNLGWDRSKLTPMLGTYRAETPDSYTGFDEDVIPNYGIYNVPQTSDAAWAAFGSLNGGTLLLTGAVIDVEDPATASVQGVPSIGGPNLPVEAYGSDGAFSGYASEIQIHWYAQSDATIRAGAVSGAHGDTGYVPPQDQIPNGSIRPTQLTPGADGQHLVTAGGVAQWAAESPVPLALDDLTDVATAGAADNDVLAYDAASSSWGPGAAGGGATDLDAVHKTDFDAKGDLVAGTGVDTFDNLPTGTEGQILAANPAKATGLEWVDAPAGSNLAGYSDIWVWTTKTADANTAGQIGVNAASWAAVTQINVNEKTKDNRDLSKLAFPRFQVGDQLYLQMKTDASRYAFFEISGPGTDHGTWWSWPVTYVSSAGAILSGNADTNLTWLVTGSGASGGIPETLLDAKGDLIAASAADVAARLPVGSNGQVLTVDSAQALGIKWAAAAGGGGAASDVQTFTASGTWTKPAGAKAVRVICVGAGGGGGSGCSGAGAVAKSGGSGGGGGGIWEETFRADDLAGSVAVTVGGGGPGAAAAPSGVNGLGGTDGGVSSFGAYAKAGGGGGGNGGGSTGNGGGSGGNYLLSAPTGGQAMTASQNALGNQSATGQTSAAGWNTELGGASGGGSVNTTGAAGAGGSSTRGGPGGGGGAGHSATPAVGSAAAGGLAGAYAVGGGGTPGTSGASPTAGGPGGAAPAGHFCGSGGGGGGATVAAATAGGKGGDGGGRGSGGGGGGSSANGGVGSGGAGGKGGDGLVVVIAW